MQYNVIRNHLLDELIKDVNNALNLGWKPLGGVEVTLYVSFGNMYHQAMIKE